MGFTYLLNYNGMPHFLLYGNMVEKHDNVPTVTENL